MPELGHDHSSIPPLAITTYTSRGALGAAPNSSAPASITWVANLVIYVPILIPWDYTVRRVFWINGSTASSNAEFGIYTAGGAKVYSTGSVGQSGASTPQYTTPTAFTLTAGLYYFACGYTGTTNRGWGSTSFTANTLRLLGCFQEASAIAMPSAATFAQVSNALFPHCGITSRASGG